MGSLIKLSPQPELQYIEILFLGIKNLFNYGDLLIWIFLAYERALKYKFLIFQVDTQKRGC